MNLSHYIESVRHGVTNAAALADDNTQQVASRLGTAIESATRLALIQALSDAAATISAELAPASVEVRMTGQDPDFVVSIPQTSAEPTFLVPADAEPPLEEPEEEEPLARISLRLPNSVKVRVDEMADRDGISTNAWLIRAVVDALAERRRGDAFTSPHDPGQPWGGGVFGPGGPFGPNGIFGAGGPFGTGRPERPERPDRPGRPERPERPERFTRPDRPSRTDRSRHDRDQGGSSGAVQGWVR